MAETVSLETQVAVLKQEVEFINRLFTRLEMVINKIDSQHDSLLSDTSKIQYNLTDTKQELEELYVKIEDSNKTINSKIEALELRLNKEIENLNKSLTNRVEKNETTVADLLKSKWLVWGGGFVAVWVVSNIDLLKKIFSVK